MEGLQKEWKSFNQVFAFSQEVGLKCTPDTLCTSQEFAGLHLWAFGLLCMEASCLSPEPAVGDPTSRGIAGAGAPALCLWEPGFCLQIVRGAAHVSEKLLWFYSAPSLSLMPLQDLKTKTCSIELTQ